MLLSGSMASRRGYFGPDEGPGPHQDSGKASRSHERFCLPGGCSLLFGSPGNDSVAALLNRRENLNLGGHFFKARCFPSNVEVYRRLRKGREVVSQGIPGFRRMRVCLACPNGVCLACPNGQCSRGTVISWKREFGCR